MIKLIFISLLSILFLGCTEESKKKDELLSKIEKLQKSNDALQKKNDSLNNALNEVKDEFDELIFSQEQGIDSPGFEYMPYKYRSQAKNKYINVEEDAKSESDKNFKKSMDKLKTPRNTIPFEEVADPFEGSGSGQTFGGGSMGTAGGEGVGLGPGPTGGHSEYGDLVRINSPVPPQYETEFSGNICVELLIDQRGAAISAKSFSSTNHPEKEVIDSVVLYVAKNIRFKAEPGAPNRKAFYTVYVQAN